MYGKLGNSLSPLVKSVASGLFSKAKNIAASGLMQVKEEGVPLARSVATNAVNNLPGFYGGTVARGKAYTKGALKTANNMVLEQLNPVTRKTREQFGISKTTQDVAKKTIKTLEGKKGVDIQTRQADISRLKKGITAAKTRGDEQSVSSLSKELNAIKPVTDKEAKLIRESGKEAQGQLSYQFMQNEMQGTPSKILREKFKEENYLDVLPLNRENYIDLQDFKFWEMDKFTNPNDIMSTAFDRIQNAWGKALNVDDTIMFVKKTFASKASSNLANEINQFAVTDALINKVLNQKPIKKFKTPVEMSEYLTTELNKKKNWRPVSKFNKTKESKSPNFEIRDGMLWYGESYNSSAKELGGVNLQTAILPDGNALQFISDVQDLGKMKMPAGQQGLTVSLPLYKNYYIPKKKMGVPDESKAYDAAQKLLSKERAGLFDEFNVMESMRTGDAPAMPAGIGGMSSNQTALVKEIAQLKPDSLTLDEWVTYLSKMGIGASIVTPMAEGMLSGSEK